MSTLSKSLLRRAKEALSYARKEKNNSKKTQTIVVLTLDLASDSVRPK